MTAPGRPSGVALSPVEPVLVADIGGTNARFAVARADGAGGHAVEQVATYRVEDHADIHDAALAYHESIKGDHPRRGCLAVAGPIQSDEVSFTNSSWRFTTDELRDDLGLDALLAVNDFVAFARGAVAVGPTDVAPVLEGAPEPGAPIAVLGPGTGLGLGLVIQDPHGGAPRVVPTEGGHAAFAPSDALEAEVWRVLHAQQGYVSYEDLLSGAGLARIHHTLAGALGVGASARPLAPAEITAAARDGAHPVARRAVEMFCAVLGGYAGDAVLMLGARGGVYLGGGILPRIADVVTVSAFGARFRSKGTMSAFVADTPVWLVTREGVALAGAAALLEDRRDSA